MSNSLLSGSEERGGSGAGEMGSQFQALRDDMNRQFHATDTKINWVIGSALAMALAVIGALLKH